MIKNFKWLLLSGLFIMTLAIAISFSNKANTFSASQIPTQSKGSVIGSANAMMLVKKEPLVKITSVVIPPRTNNADSLTYNQTITSKNSAIINKDRLAVAEKYPEETPANNPTSREYHNTALQTGYIETYPQLKSSIMASTNGQTVAKDALNAFNKMRQAASREGISLKVLSGFRSIETQKGIFDEKARRMGRIRAADFSAPPGHSQHHTGLALDINSLMPSFRGTAAYRWLKKNAPSYGFMLSFENSQGDLGPKNEPWHWVYVEDPRAMQLMSCFITRAKSNGYDPLQGDAKSTEIHKKVANTTTCAS